MTAFGGTREPDDYSVILQALRYASQEAAQAGMLEVADTYSLTLVRLVSGDLEIQPKRLVR
jgi:hypothetical protein